MSADDTLTVKVEAINDDGVHRFEYGEGPDNESAVADALATIIRDTADDTFVMTEWWAA